MLFLFAILNNFHIKAKYDRFILIFQSKCVRIYGTHLERRDNRDTDKESAAKNNRAE